jgi:hypothetical protein
VLPDVDQDQPEWVRRFGASMRTERASPIHEPLPQAIAATLQALEETERKMPRESKLKSPKR